jgi:hypothetical protein
LRQEQKNRWKTVKLVTSHFEAGTTEQVEDREARHQTQTLRREPLSSKTKQLQAMKRQKLTVVVELLPGHTTLWAHMFKLRLTQQQEC